MAMLLHAKTNINMMYIDNELGSIIVCKERWYWVGQLSHKRADEDDDSLQLVLVHKYFELPSKSKVKT